MNVPTMQGDNAPITNQLKKTYNRIRFEGTIKEGLWMELSTLPAWMKDLTAMDLMMSQGVEVDILKWAMKIEDDRTTIPEWYKKRALETEGLLDQLCPMRMLVMLGVISKEKAIWSAKAFEIMWRNVEDGKKSKDLEEPYDGRFGPR